MNKAILKGRIGSDVDVKDINGTKCTRFSLATSKKYKDKDGNFKEQTQWHSCIAWRQTAELISKFFSKGSEILLEGEIQYRQWESNGEKKYATDIVVEGFEFCGSKSDVQPSHSPAPQPSVAPPVVEEDSDLPF